MSTAVRVPFLDLGAQQRELRQELDGAAARVLRAERVLLGPELESFETSWAAEVGAGHAVGVGSGLDAIVIALRALGIGPGDEVIVPAHTFIATWLGVLHAGATPVPVDVDGDTGRWPVEAVAAAVTPRTAALLPVHLYGHPVDLEPFLALARRHGLAVVDDAAQAHGARLRGRPVGSGTSATAWSFYPGKNLGALGDGGAVSTDDPSVAARVRALRNYGSVEKYRHEDVGWNSRLDEMQAAFLSVKLRRLGAWNRCRREVAEVYATGLGGMDHVSLPTADVDAEPVWHLYVVRTPERDRLRGHLTDRGVETLVHYPVPLTDQPAFAGTPLGGLHLPGAARLAAEGVSLPMGPHLNRDQQAIVLDAVQEFVP